MQIEDKYDINYFEIRNKASKLRAEALRKGIFWVWSKLMGATRGRQLNLDPEQAKSIACTE